MNPKRAARWVRRSLSAVLLFLVLPAAWSVPLGNGDFSDPFDLAGWTPVGTRVGEPTGAFAQLGTDGSFQRTLEQAFTLLPSSARLTFDFAFSTDASPVGPAFPDSLTASLVTTGGDFLDVLVVDWLGVVPDPSDGIESQTGAFPIEVGFDPTVTIPGFVAFAGGTGYSGRISLALPAALLGQGATLYFDLFDQTDGAATIAAVDNVSVQAAPVPATPGLLIIGLAAGAAARRRGTAANGRRVERGWVGAAPTSGAGRKSFGRDGVCGRGRDGVCGRGRDGVCGRGRDGVSTPSRTFAPSPPVGNSQRFPTGGTGYSPRPECLFRRRSSARTKRRGRGACPVRPR